MAGKRQEVSQLGEAILTILKGKITKLKKKLATNTLEPPEHISKEFPTCNINFLANIKLLEIWMFEIKLELQEPDVIFNPPIDKAIVNNFSDQVNGFCTDIFYMAELIPRIAAHQTKEGKANDYLDVMENQKELKNMKDTFIARIQDCLNKANKLKTAQNTYSYIWTDSRTEYMHYFLTYSRQLTAEEVEMIEEDDKAVKKQYPSLIQFQEQIDFFENWYIYFSQLV